MGALQSSGLESRYSVEKIESSLSGLWVWKFNFFLVQAELVERLYLFSSQKENIISGNFACAAIIGRLLHFLMLWQDYYQDS